MPEPQNKYYDAYWANKSWTPTARLSPVLKGYFDGCVKSEDSLLDVGCGDGQHYAYILAQRVRQYTGLDVSLEALKIAAKQGIQPNIWSGLGRMPFKDNCFDVALCIEVLEHLYNPEQVVNEIHRILKPGGTAIVTVPNIGYFRERLLLLKGTFNPGGSPLTAWTSPWCDPHIRFFTPKTLKALFSTMDFNIYAMTGDGGNPVGDLPLIAKLARGRIIFPRLAGIAQRYWPALWGSKIVLIAKKGT